MRDPEFLLSHTSVAVDCALAGIRAVDPYAIVVDALSKDHNQGGVRLTGAVSVIAIGKAAAAMARGADSVLHAQVSQGIVVAPVSVETLGAQWRTYHGGHPIPTEAGECGARDIETLAASLTDEDTLLCLISGGASALITLPAEGVALTDVQVLTSYLLRAGATIEELNCVRKHIDRLKGGRLTRLAAPARVIALVLSDVIGDPLDVIASGPTVPDPTTIGDAIQILKNRNVWHDAPLAIRRHLETGADESPKPGDACFSRATSVVIGNNLRAAEFARTHAAQLGYEAFVVTTTLAGESRDVGQMLAESVLAVQKDRPSPYRPHCLVYAGETTVTVTGGGRGGRNQELALAAAITLDGTSGITLVSVGTDGIDGPTDAAGAIANGQTLGRARALGLDAQQALDANDAYPFWHALGDLVITGPTGTNVMDLIVLTVE